MTSHKHWYHVAKKTDSWGVKDLHTIFLLNSEENHTYKRIGREAMRSGIDHRQSSLYQYSQPQCSAMAHIINRRLVFDYQQYIQQPLSLACSNLKICYDRIFHSAAKLALKLLGIPLMSIINMLDSVKRMSHKVRTAYGDYNITYGRDTIPKGFRYFMIGICQGNGCAPRW